MGWFETVGAALGMATLVMLTPAAAQQGQGPEGRGPGTMDLGEVLARGHVAFAPEDARAFLLRSGFTIEEEATARGGKVATIVASAPNGMPFAFVLQDCGLQGCLVIETFHPIPLGAMRVTLSDAEMNEINRVMPMPIFLTAEAEAGFWGVRGRLPALIGCDVACQESSHELYFSSVIRIYEVFKRKGAQQLVSYAPRDEEFGRTGPAFAPPTEWPSLPRGIGPERALVALRTQLDTAFGLRELGLDGHFTAVPDLSDAAFPDLIQD